MITRFNSLYTKKILISFAKHKFMVKVPQAALYTDAELKLYDTKSFYIDGAEVNKKALRNFDIDTTTDSISYTADPVDIDKDNNINKRSKLRFRRVYIPITEIIDIYSNGFTIYLCNRNDILRLTNTINDLLDQLEHATDISTAKPIIDTIEDFYKTFIGNKHKEIDKQLNKTPVVSNVLGFDSNLMSDEIKNRKIQQINLDDILVN